MNVGKAFLDASMRRDLTQLAELVDPEIELHGTVGGVQEGRVYRGLTEVIREYDEVGWRGVGGAPHRARGVPRRRLRGSRSCSTNSAVAEAVESSWKSTRRLSSKCATDEWCACRDFSIVQRPGKPSDCRSRPALRQKCRHRGRPTGFEPVTFGLVDRGGSSVGLFWPRDSAPYREWSSSWLGSDPATRPLPFCCPAQRLRSLGGIADTRDAPPATALTPPAVMKATPPRNGSSPPLPAATVTTGTTDAGPCHLRGGSTAQGCDRICGRSVSIRRPT